MCLSMYSDMSIRTIAFSSSNRYSVSARASSVLPTPVGPRNMKLPMGRFGSLSPALARRIASEIKAIASFCPITLSPRLFSMLSSRSDSPSNMRVTGIPVISATVSAMSSSSTVPSNFSR